MVRYVDLVEETICAPITAPGYAGVSVIRISGPQSLKKTRELCPFLPEQPESHRAYFGDFKKQSGPETLDQVLVTYFAKGKSFTGDEVIEISCHGNPLITNMILNQYFEQGCRLAEKGEFSFRAFYNGKIDLVQAESINDLITSSSNIASNTALSQLTGRLSTVFKTVEKDLLKIIGHLEAGIDFVEQDIEPEASKELLPSLDALRECVDELVESYDVGKNLGDGFRVLLVGKTNVGKSSLFNCLFQEDKAIVTNIPGTTRDLIQEQSFLGNLSVKFIDSAGLRESNETIERMGMQKTLEEVDKASLLLWVIDSSQDFPREYLKILPMHKVLIVFNKTDLINDEKKRMLLADLKNAMGEFDRIHFISVLENEGVGELKKSMGCFLEPHNRNDLDVTVTQPRHFDHLSKMAQALTLSRQMIENEESPDLVSQELQQALAEIHALLGIRFDDQILDTIFSEFCIGK